MFNLLFKEESLTSRVGGSLRKRLSSLAGDLPKTIYQRRAAPCKRIPILLETGGKGYSADVVR